MRESTVDRALRVDAARRPRSVVLTEFAVRQNLRDRELAAAVLDQKP